MSAPSQVQFQFPSSFFKNNRDRLKAGFREADLFVIAGHGLLQRNADTAHPFRQDSNFWYLTGIEEPDVVLVMDGDDDYLIVPERSKVRAIFDGAVGDEELIKVSDIREVLGNQNGWQRLGERLRQAKRVAVTKAPPQYDKFHGIFTNPARARLSNKLKRYNKELELVDLRPHLARVRMVKQPEELEAIRRAIAITAAALGVVKENLASYKNEHEIENDITSVFSRHQSIPAYWPIIAFGKNACTLHYGMNNGPIAESGLLLIDAGAEWQNYASDITRTFSKGELTKRHQAVLEAAADVQRFAFTMLKPDITMRKYELAVEKRMGKKLKELGLIKKTDRKSIRKYFPHASSHFLGLDTHDAADYTLPLAAGMVLTVEPGIYIPEESIGVRIEDDVLITKNGIEILSKDT
jgi:Xaa-Pro aminopeptidase